MRRDVGQIPQPQTSDSSGAARSIKAREESEDAGWRARSIVAYCGSCGELSGSPAQTADITVANAWVSRRASFIYLFSIPKWVRKCQQIQLDIAGFCGRVWCAKGCCIVAHQGVKYVYIFLKSLLIVVNDLTFWSELMTWIRIKYDCVAKQITISAIAYFLLLQLTL